MTTSLNGLDLQSFSKCSFGNLLISFITFYDMMYWCYFDQGYNWIHRDFNVHGMQLERIITPEKYILE